MASQSKNIRVFWQGLCAMIEACESRAKALKEQMSQTKNEDEYADLGNDYCVLRSALDMLYVARDEWRREIADNTNKHKDERA